MGRRKGKSRSTGEEEDGSQTKTSNGLSCQMCGKIFKNEHKLKIHVRSHTGETPYSCPHCEKSFAQNAALKVHIRTHTGERPFACEKCGKRFARADHLRQHDRTHTGEKPYECPMCGKPFATWSAISRHKSEHLSRDNFSCSICNKTFARSDNLRSHMAKTHKVDVKSVDDCVKPEVDHEGSEGVSDPVDDLQNSEQIPKDGDDILKKEDEYTFEPHFLANV